MPAITAKALAACMTIASQTYDVPTSAMLGIMRVEGGRLGGESHNQNGTYDLGPMQINTIWLPKLAAYWNMDVDKVREFVRDDACVNVTVAAWIFRQKINESGHLLGGIERYHSATPSHGVPYAAKVVGVMNKMGMAHPDLPSAADMRLLAARYQTADGYGGGYGVPVYRAGKKIHGKPAAVRPLRIVAKVASARASSHGPVPVYRATASRIVVSTANQGVLRATKGKAVED